MILGEYTWQQFKNLRHISVLTEAEQVRQYHFYLDSLSNQRLQQNKGPQSGTGTTPTPSPTPSITPTLSPSPTPSATPETYLILQENLDYVLQEDGNRLIWQL